MKKGMQQYFVFQLNFETMKRSQKVSSWRKLYGYTQKAGKKQYETVGLVKKVKGKHLSKGILIIPGSRKDKFIKFLDKNCINYTVFEVWGNDLCD